MSDGKNIYNRQEYIELYLSGKLAIPDREKFEAAMQQDPSLAAEVELMRHVFSGFRHKGETSVLEEMKAISSEEQLKMILRNAEHKTDLLPERKRKRTFLWYSAVAVVAVVLLVVVGSQPRYSSSELYAWYYEIPEYEYFPSRGGSLWDDRYLQYTDSISRLYEDRKYQELLSLFEEQFPMEEFYSLPQEVLFYSAICLMETGDWEKAGMRWERLLSAGHTDFEPEVLWYLSLVRLQLKEREGAEKILLELADYPGKYQTDAVRLLEQLMKKRWF